MQDLFPDSEFYSTDSVCIFMLEQHYFYYCSFEIGDCVLKLGGVSPPTLFFFFFFKVFDYSTLFAISCEF